ncbi:dTDP-4-dehydrorhamnose reductase [Ochrobactrum sp. MH181795]|uniref:dTDP-4-dehydrorhamnose reductase n=1 Tax=Brucella anthropi TaxID=529 RepID=UPI000F452C3A|nr:dTDP-4-dehydrorhamnose reductase [Brucella anthropi]KAB2723441.1 dTDP-4-dehydrorhamnose reductase [Brucella anthropi]KAB2736732.1 dTDP-4-dehydrorhamnose reductase [Brucella anthropi]KAB2797749.1 dTDP-4-dehydrorhamnose reductase [Brucella anthropi]RNL41122.1 dTDP-4-dehydrorhamnose reductase [Ochrobactrum sp. MH181795]
MRVLVTGREGQIARSLRSKAAARSDMELITLGRPDIDLLQPDTVMNAITRINPDIVISAAAYTAVDKAEVESDIAYQVNTIGAGAVSRAAAACGAPIVHWSTDYVFDGASAYPYTEKDEKNPCNVYGKTKMEGESLVAEYNESHIILRTSSVYSPYGTNFVKTMLNIAQTREQISVVSDQWVNPSSAFDLADGALRVVDVIRSMADFSNFGVFHLVGAGDTNWSNFARQVFFESRKYGGPSAEITPISSNEYPTKAKRPSNSRLNTEKFTSVFKWTMPHWESSLQSVVKDILEEVRNDH